jgi:hypothetical protein
VTFHVLNVDRGCNSLRTKGYTIAWSNRKGKWFLQARAVSRGQHNQDPLTPGQEVAYGSVQWELIIGLQLGKDKI